MDREFFDYLERLREYYTLSPPTSRSDEAKCEWLLAYASSYTLARASDYVGWDTSTVDRHLATNAVKWIKRGTDISCVLTNLSCSTDAFMEALKDDRDAAYKREGDLIASLKTCTRRLARAHDGNSLRADIIRTRREALIELREAVDALERLKLD